jgi:hypothetical protein
MEPSWHVLGPEPARFGPAPGQYRKTLASERMQRSLCPFLSNHPALQPRC